MQIILDSIHILTTFTFLTHDDELSFICYCLLQFVSAVFLQFSLYKSLPFLVKFILKCFILFHDFLNGFFFISFLDCSFLVYTKATNFYVFISYLATLLNSFISSNKFIFVESVGISTYKIMWSVKCDSFTPSFSIWAPSISFSYLCALSRTFSNRVEVAKVVIHVLFRFWKVLSRRLTGSCPSFLVITLAAEWRMEGRGKTGGKNVNKGAFQSSMEGH